MGFCASKIISNICWLLIAITLTGCSQGGTTPTHVPAVEEEFPTPTPASSLAELIDDLSDEDMAVRLVSIYELEKYQDGAVAAIDPLIENLYVRDFDVRTAAARTLGGLGPLAKKAIPDLTHMLLDDEHIHARSAAAYALGEIGNPVAVPDLAMALFEENSYGAYNVQIAAARSIARITGEKFTDSDSTTGYELDDSGVPLIVMDAQKWWLETGQHQEWVSN